MKSKGKLFLIPSSLGSTETDHILPKGNLPLMEEISIFIVENVRTARRFLRSAGYNKDFDEVQFYVLDKRTQAQEMHNFLQHIDKQNIGLLSEAGLPCIADPGARIVRIAHNKGIEVLPLVGPSSIMLALMASGFNGQQFAFHGYLPIRQSEREKKIAEIEGNIYRDEQTQIFIETPYRNMQMLSSLLKVCKGSTWLCIAWDLTLPSQRVISRPIENWSASEFDLHKKPAVFLLYK
ncbi:MAG: SAM-dependent methyltransferase [Bacteroidota bacterium]|nr:SAM-dependent methyltransferase [Bacteroidota bacterium]